MLNYLGYSWADMGQNLAQARTMIEKAVQRRPNDGAIVDSLGWVMLRQGEVADAVSDAGARGRAGTARMRRSTAISATPIGRPAASWRRPTSGAAR